MARLLRPELVVDGVWLGSQVTWGDLEWVNCWPGGTESITFDVARPHRRLKAGALVQVAVGSRFVAGGLLDDPVRGDQLRAEGLFRKGEDWTAFDASFIPSLDPDVAVSQAITRGLPWVKDVVLGGSPVDLESDTVHSVSQLLDAAALGVGGQEWGILGDRRLARSFRPAASLHMVPGVDGLAISRQGYASVLYARFNDSASGVYQSVGWEDADATRRWGRVERTLPDLLGEGRPMTVAEARTILIGILEQGASQIGWTKPLEIEFGDIVNNRQQPVDPATITRETTRLHGLTDDVGDLVGATTADLRLARITHRSDGSALLEPVGLVAPMNDALAAA